MAITQAGDFNKGGSVTLQTEVWILGQPKLRQYLDYIRDMTPGGAGAKQVGLIDEWRTANDHYYELEMSEPGIADQIGIGELDPAMLPLAKKVAADPRFELAFEGLPSRFCMIELDKLVVQQPHVNLDHIERLKSRCSLGASPQDLFAFCMPLDRAEAPVHMRRTGARRFSFWSDSSDFRFHEPAVLNAAQVSGHDWAGPVGGMIGLTVGFGSNFLTAIQSDSRLLLHNGHHRAYALRDMGFTHAPCLIQTVTRLDELDLVAPQHVLAAPAFYFKAARPPLLKDFFNPALRKEHLVYKTQHMIELSFEVRDYEIKDMAIVD